jgi:hypothetical protein
VAIKPLAVATIQRLPQRTIIDTPDPGSVAACCHSNPIGPREQLPASNIKNVQPSIVVGLVSGAGSMSSRDVTEPVRSWTAGEAMLEETARS